MSTQLLQFSRRSYSLVSVTILLAFGLGCTSTTENGSSHPTHQQTTYPGPSVSPRVEGQESESNLPPSSNEGGQVEVLGRGPISSTPRISTRTSGDDLGDPSNVSEVVTSPSPQSEPGHESPVERSPGELRTARIESLLTLVRTVRTERTNGVGASVYITEGGRADIEADIAERLGEVFQQEQDWQRPHSPVEAAVVADNVNPPSTADVVYDYAQVKAAYLTQSVLPLAIQERAKELLNTYRTLIFYGGMENMTLQRAHNEWVLNTFHFLVHAGNIWDERSSDTDSPAPESGVAINRVEIQSAVDDYYKLWSSYPAWAASASIGNRIALTKRHYLNLMDGIQWQLSELEALDPQSVAFSATRSRYLTMIDTLNLLFQVHPRELNLISVGEFVVDPYQTLKAVMDLTDQRFFKVLAPFWKWLAFHPTGLRTPGLSSQQIKHPLTRLYFNRAGWARRQASLVLGGDRPQEVLQPLPVEQPAEIVPVPGVVSPSTVWQVRNFNCALTEGPDFGVPLFCRVEGALPRPFPCSLITTTTEPSEEMIRGVQLNEVFSEFDRFQLRDETDSFLRLAISSDDLAALAPQQRGVGFEANVERDIYQYLQRLTDVEIARYVLEEDHVRQSVRDTLGSQVIHSRATLRLKTQLLLMIRDLLKQRRWVSTESSARPVQGPSVFEDASVVQSVDALFAESNIASPAESDAAQQVMALHTGLDGDYSRFYTVNLQSAQLNIQPGIYTIQQDFTLALGSVTIHPLAILLQTPPPPGVARRVVNATANAIGSIARATAPFVIDAIFSGNRVRGANALYISPFSSSGVPVEAPVLQAQTLFDVTIRESQQTSTLNHFAFF